jgi:serine/threonine protein phosphatase 1
MVSDRRISFAEAAAPAGMRIYAIGDIHGRFDLLTEMHGRILEEIERDEPGDWRIIYLGDYVDRGPETRQVLEFLSDATAAESPVIALAGNHDTGMVDFLESPSPDGIFARHGGNATARSYGVELAFSSPKILRAGHAKLIKAIPAEHLAFLRGLPFSAAFGDLFFCHAGIRPGVPLDQQTDDDLTWIRREFQDFPSLHPKLIVHGHTPRSKPEILPNRVNLDTGAVNTGVLTGMRFEGREKTLLQVAGPAHA